MYGQARLRAGFMPDPHVMGGTTGGPVRADQLNTRWRGTISGQTFLLHVAWQGRPVAADRWSGNATQRGPRWSR